MKKITVLALMSLANLAIASDIKPTEYRQVTIIGIGNNSFNACNDANNRAFNSKKVFVGTPNVDLRPLPNGGYISIITRTEKVTH
jgi:hypothetical protein